MSQVQNIEIFLVDLAQDQPYLGDLRAGETVNESGYFVRQGNRTVYPRKNRSLVVKITTRDGTVGWGETYGLVAPKATAEIISDLLTGFVIDREPDDVESIHDELYDLMRVRGYTGGFYLDALAAIDIALWDLRGKQLGQSIGELLGGGQRELIPAYISGLPESTLEKRCSLAKEWQAKGFAAFKFALPVADDGAEAELKALRETLGETDAIACDLHWSLSPKEAISLAHDLHSYTPWFLEAPVAPEDVEGLARVAANTNTSIAVGEEWRTIHEAKLRIDQNACQIVQPEMGHTGITQFMRIAHYATEKGLTIIPHATIGSGIFLAASLQTCSALAKATYHEFQHSIFYPFQHFADTPLICQNGHYELANRPGLGFEPSQTMLKNVTLLNH